MGVVADVKKQQSRKNLPYYVKREVALKVGREHPEAVHIVASGAVSYATKNPLAGAVSHVLIWHSPLTDLWKSKNNYQESPDVFNQDSSKVNILSPVLERESTRRVPSSSQQGRRRGGTSGWDPTKIATVKVVWKSGKKGGKKRPTCPKGFRLGRVGKRLMCVAPHVQRR